ncbi:MAG: hypothetical protein OEW48_09875 [Phycisphaerae bacterium]|nr:hypothetical protein [Phycisphaerae bacterium]
MTIQVPYVICLALTPIERWKAVVHPLSAAFANGTWLTAFAGIVLIISVILLFRIIVRHRRFEHHLKQEIAKLTTINIELRQEIDKLHQEQVEVLEDIIDAEPPGKEIPGFNPQEMRALSELAKRLS